jgi:ankyrin repeat protein
VAAYLQIALDLVAMCNTESMTTTEMADAVALIDQGVDQHAKDIYGSTPLHLACRYGLAEVVKALLEKDAGLHAKDSDGYTPLYNASMNGNA